MTMKNVKNWVLAFGFAAACVIGTAGGVTATTAADTPLGQGYETTGHEEDHEKDKEGHGDERGRGERDKKGDDRNKGDERVGGDSSDKGDDDSSDANDTDGPGDDEDD